MKGFLIQVIVLILLNIPVKVCYSGNEFVLPADSVLTLTEAFKYMGDHLGWKLFYPPVFADSLSPESSVRPDDWQNYFQQIQQKYDLYYYADTTLNMLIFTHAYQLRTRLPFGFFEPSTIQDESIDIASLELEKQMDEVDIKKDDFEGRIFEIGPKTQTLRAGRASIAGYIRDKDSGEPVIGALVYIEEPRIGTTTDQFGYYSFSIPRGRNTLILQSVGMKETRRQIILYSNGQFNVEMEEAIVPLKEVIIEADRETHVRGVQMGLDKLSVQTIKQMPLALGEADIIKSILTLPGVQTVGEAATGFNVRGGSVDQNLILVSEAPLFNPAHLFGVFSSVNPDIVRNVELYKGGIPAQYGGRISSVMDIQLRDGNKKKFTGNGGIGPITGRLNLEGPIVEDKASFLLGLRSTYSDWILQRLPEADFRNSSAGFMDANARLSFDLNENNSLFINGYFSDDRFRLRSDSLFNYNNYQTSVQWKHIFSNKLYAVFSGIFSRYTYNIESDAAPETAFDLGYRIDNHQIKADFSYFPSSGHKIDFGVSSILYDLRPGSFLPRGENSLVQPRSLNMEKGLETALYAGDRFEISDMVSLYVGLRYSFYQQLGPANVYTYADGATRDQSTITDTTRYGNWQTAQTYHGPEYRMSLNIGLDASSSIKIGYNKMRQYIHMVSNTQAISPTDIWKLSDTHIRPQVGDQISLGWYRNYRFNTIETSVEAFYKNMNDVLDFKNGAVLVMNELLETDVINGRGKAYGIEWMIRKRAGKLNGWLSYTYSRSLIRVAGAFASEIINRGEWFPSNFDKPHDFTLVSNYKFTRRFGASGNFTYSTGRPITYPLAIYDFAGSPRVHFSDRNAFRIPDYIRLDLSFNLEGNHKVDKPAHGSWSFSLINALGRANVYSMFFVTEGGRINGYTMSIFARPIPTITYNFRF
ncbi:MAG: TonB-dependent receptor [Cyclobacteriaceae bacterium]|nr:TonB-dependent receptor [Cyclobacteriaceae bacterium]